MKALVNKFIASVAVVMVMTSCSQEDVAINDLQANRAISYNVTANKATRAANYFDAATDINQFYVSAWATGGKTTNNGIAYFTQDNLRNLSGWKYDSGVRYWPNDGEALNFFAWTFNTQADLTETSTIDGADKATFEFNAQGEAYLNGIKQENAADMNDLLYAATYDQTYGTSKPAGEKAVTMSFNHALAQVGIKAKVDNPKMRIQVAEVALVNIKSVGDFKFPAQDTKTAAADALDANYGSWSAADDATNETYAATIADEIVDYTTGLVDLTGAKNTFMVLPLDDYDAADGSTITTDAGGKATIEGTCIRMSVKIWNVADYTNGYDASDIQIFGDGGYDYIYIPVDFSWQPGKNYTYTITFGTGNAGYDGNGDNTLVKVTYDPEIMPWNEGGNTGSTH